MAGAFHPFRHMDKSFRCMEFYDRKAQSASFLGVCIFYDRRELFCPRILSFHSGSCWVRLIFSGSLKKAYQRKGELASAWDLPQSKPIRGRHKESIFIFILRKDFIKIFSMDFKNLCNNPDENLHENILRKKLSLFRSFLAQKSGENL